LFEECVDEEYPLPNDSATSSVGESLQTIYSNSKQSTLNQSDQLFCSESSFDFFNFFQQEAKLPMDEPGAIFQFLNNSQPQLPLYESKMPETSDLRVPNCFSKITDIEDLFPSISFLNINQENLQHACKSRGLPACESCSFNIENIMPQPYDITTEIQMQTPDTSLSVNSPPTLGHFISTLHLKKLSHTKGFDAAISSYIEISCQKNINISLKDSTDLCTDSHNSLIVINTAPCCIISPSGLIKNANFSFMKLLTDNTQSCLYAYLDLSSILSLFDLINSYRTLHTPTYGRINMEGKGYAVSLTLEGIWIILNFIPIV
jgi:hypothetical protein